MESRKCFPFCQLLHKFQCWKGRRAKSKLIFAAVPQVVEGVCMIYRPVSHETFRMPGDVGIESFDKFDCVMMVDAAASQGMFGVFSVYKGGAKKMLSLPLPKRVQCKGNLSQQVAELYAIKTGVVLAKRVGLQKMTSSSK